MEVRPGYKQTEVGIIPDEWGVDTLRSFVRNHNSGIYKKSALYGRGCNIVGVSDLYGIDCVDGQRFAEVPLTTEEKAKHTLVCNDLLYGESSLVRDGIARTVFVTSQGEGTAFAWHTRRYAIDQDRLFAPYLYYYLQSHCARKHMMDHSIQTAITGINTVAYFACPIARADPPEQRAIAKALNDVDALLGGLDRFIAKKRDLRQAAMQQLLTSQTRLSGFSGQWEMRRLGDHVTFLRNGVNSRAELHAEGGVKYLHYGDVHACKDVFMSPRALPSLPNAKAASLDRLSDGDLVVVDASEDVVGITKSVEIRNVGDSEVVPGLHTIAARFDKKVLADGFKGFLQSCPPFASHLRRLAAGTKVYATNRAHIASVEMRLPPVAEQTVIAAVLSDMDAEIAALEQRRDKTRDLKTAMMQELLTGRTRLVKPKAAHA
jgi:type I restriction enzyme S subunit